MFEPGQKYSRWQSVVKRHQKQIWAACRRYARDDEATLRDLVQEVCLVLWLKIDRLRPNVSAGEERLWVLFQTRTALRLCRKKYITREECLEMVSIDLVNSCRREESETLDELVAWLPEADRQLVDLYRQGYPVAEIAGQLGIAPASVRTRMHRIVKKLKATIENNNKQ